MRKIKVVSTLFAILALGCFPILLAQNVQSIPDADPRLNKAMPTAYVLLDHIGPRVPIEPSEGNTGLFLQLHNNCRTTLVVAIVKNKNASVPSVLDEVIPNPKIVLGAGTPWMPSPGFPNGPGWDDLQAYPNQNEQAVRAAEFDAHRHAKNPRGEGRTTRPSGYGWDLAPILTAIPPGDTLLFSLPATHVSREWHIEIPFRLGLEHDPKVRPPYSYLALYWEDLTEEYRSKMSGNSNETGTTNGSFVHEQVQPN